MGPFSWAGINYNSTSATDATDLPYLYALGFRKLRMLIIACDSAGAKATWRAKCLLAKSYGFPYIIYGVSANGSAFNPLTAANWASYVAQVESEADYCEANGICDEFQIGNEEELHIDGTTLTGTTLRSNMRTLATDIQARFSGVVSLSASWSNEGTVGWISDNNIGDLDKIGINIYSLNAYDDKNFKGPIQNLQTAFTTKAYVSEWGLYSSWASVPTDVETQTLRVTARQKILNDISIPSAYFYNWISSNDQFGLKHTSGAYRQMFNALMTGNKRRVFIEVF